jgi:hypothetical protein
VPNRTTETAVREIMQTNLTTPQILAFISDASLWVTEEMTSLGYTDARLEVIERYLSCALVRTRDLGLSNATISDITENYQADPEVTDYLLRAASFDTTGKVRQHFLAPKPVAARTPIVLPVKFNVGTGFVDESPKSTNQQIVSENIG